MEAATQVLLVPIFRHHWLWYAWGTAAATTQGAARGGGAAAAVALRHWREGRNLEEKAQLVGQSLSRKLQNRLWTEWHKLETARTGTLRNWGYRMAQAVLAREDPRETFLKRLPPQASPVEVVYPTAYREKVVRRHLRHVAASAHWRHTVRLFWWSLAMVPQLPLMATPLPNITVYYTGYRIYSHYRALQGTKALQECLAQLDSQQMQRLRDELLRFQEQHPGFKFPRDEWPAKLLRREHRYLDMLERMTLLQRMRELRRQQAETETVAERGVPPLPQADAPLLTFTPSVQLNDVVRPHDRLTSPLGDEAAMEVAHLFGAEQLLELVARARRRVLGAAHPVLQEEHRRAPPGGGGSGGGSGA